MASLCHYINFIPGVHLPDNLLTSENLNEKITGFGVPSISNNTGKIQKEFIPQELEIVELNHDFGPPSLGVYYLVDTRANEVSIILPDNPVNGYWFNIFDKHNCFKYNNCKIIYHGNTIDGKASNLILRDSGIEGKFVYNNYNWQLLKSTVFAAGTTDFILKSDINTSNGIASLNYDGKLTTSQIPYEVVTLGTDNKIPNSYLGILDNNNKIDQTYIPGDILNSNIDFDSNGKIATSNLVTNQPGGVVTLDNNNKIDQTYIGDVLTSNIDFDPTGKISTSSLVTNQPGGVVTLDSNGKILNSYLDILDENGKVTGSYLNLDNYPILDTNGNIQTNYLYTDVPYGVLTLDGNNKVPNTFLWFINSNNKIDNSYLNLDIDKLVMLDANYKIPNSYLNLDVSRFPVLDEDNKLDNLYLNTNIPVLDENDKLDNNYLNLDVNKLVILDENNKIPCQYLSNCLLQDLDTYFNSLSVSSTNYNSNHLLSKVEYSNNYYKEIYYNYNEDILLIEYHSSDVLLRSLNFEYDNDTKSLIRTTVS